jgi:hypothetical protein
MVRWNDSPNALEKEVWIYYIHSIDVQYQYHSERFSTEKKLLPLVALRFELIEVVTRMWIRVQ